MARQYLPSLEIRPPTDATAPPVLQDGARSLMDGGASNAIAQEAGKWGAEHSVGSRLGCWPWPSGSPWRPRDWCLLATANSLVWPSPQRPTRWLRPTVLWPRQGLGQP